MSSTRSFTSPAGDRHRHVASCGSRAARARAVLGRYETKTSGSRTEKAGKDSPREAWGCRLLPVCSGISCASWQVCVASPLPCQGVAQNQELLCPSLLPTESGADLMATCCSRRDVAVAVQLGPESPTGTSTISAWLPRRKWRPVGRLQQGQDALTWALAGRLSAVLLQEPSAPLGLA